MVKVLRIITRLNIGGPAIHTVLLSSELNKNGSYKDVLVCGRISVSEGDMSYLAREKGVYPIVVEDLIRDISPAKDMKALIGLYSIIKKEKPDIVHTHTAKAGTLGRIAAILARVPVKVHTFHGHIFDGYFSPLKARLFLMIERFLGLFTDKVITVSDRIKGDIVANLGVVKSSKTAVIPLGFELDRFLNCEIAKGSFRKHLGFSDETFLVGIVGRLVPIKNHKMFLDAAKYFRQKRPDANVKFIVVGNGESEFSIKEYAAQIGIQQDIIFTGWVDELASVYESLDVVGLTSLNEGTPVSIIEAMASAKPVVATAVGGVEDLIRDGENGFLVKSGDFAAFAERLISLMEDKILCRNMGICGRVSVSNIYSKERLVSDIKRLYNECLAAKGISARMVS
ncbi:MAG: glycosyltransferase family 4 protein [Candidatus Omnitrophica bacterium]|nr:glycosyltransferase family 4 protein [Candidatus Omnitrophota bacterium]